MPNGKEKDYSRYDFMSFRVLASLPDDEVKQAADAIVKDKGQINTLTRKELYLVIKALPLRKKGMEEEMGFGVKFLHMLLDREGTGEVIAFSRHIQQISSREEGVYEYDFDDKARDALSAARKRHFAKEFGATMATGWLVAGAGTTAYAVPKTIMDWSQPTDAEHDKGKGTLLPSGKEEGHLYDRAKKVYERVDKTIGGPTEALIGALLSNEGLQKYKEKRDEQIDEISDAVSELVKRYPELAVPQELPTRGNGLRR